MMRLLYATLGFVLLAISLTFANASTTNKYVDCRASGLLHSEPTNITIKSEKNNQLSVTWCRTSEQNDLRLYTFQNDDFVLLKQGTSQLGWNTEIITPTQYDVYKDSVWVVEGYPTGSTIAMRYGPYFVSWELYFPNINK